MGGPLPRGFSLTVDQLERQKEFWIPSLDLFVTTGEQAGSFDEHQASLLPWKGRRILDQVEAEPEASYAPFTHDWEDMGSLRYQNPESRPPGHIVGLAWDSSIHKFGIDRRGHARSDLGSPDPFEFIIDVQTDAADSAENFRQSLTDGLPLIVTRYDLKNVHCELEQFAFPLDGPPSFRQGEVPMVLLQKLRLSHADNIERNLTIKLTHRRQRSDPRLNLKIENTGNEFVFLRPGKKDLILLIRVDGAAAGTTIEPEPAGGDVINIILKLPPKATRDLVLLLPSPPVPENLAKLARQLDYASSRSQTIGYWSNWIARGAQFQVPEDSVNELFRANLWHALRLPRRHEDPERGVKIDLPYSNFAYDQRGTPWPVNQAVYVDYMIYDLRGYHSIAAEELAAIFRDNQQADGRVGGFANWGVYTPAMMYAVAQHGLLSGDRRRLDGLLPQTLRALEWCLAQIGQAEKTGNAENGLFLAPLNDLTKGARGWAFNQAYLYAGFDQLAHLLEELNHPRAEECRQAARSVRAAVEREFSRASASSPVVQLRDQTWTPYLPSDAQTPRRMPEVWYPTDVDTGPLHLPRLRALDPLDPLTTAMLHDHEDNLFSKGLGMANEPVYNQQATIYLLRDEPKPAIRAFYSLMACGFSHSSREPVEHRWGWPQYFGPPSTDGAWFENYRKMLIDERDSDTLLLFQATPRRWLENGKRIDVKAAPTYFGPLAMSLQSRVAKGELYANIELSARRELGSLLVRFRHPDARPIKSVMVDNQPWTDFDVAREWVRITRPSNKGHEIIVRY